MGRECSDNTIHTADGDAIFYGSVGTGTVRVSDKGYWVNAVYRVRYDGNACTMDRYYNRVSGGAGTVGTQGILHYLGYPGSGGMVRMDESSPMYTMPPGSRLGVVDIPLSSFKGTEWQMIVTAFDGDLTLETLSQSDLSILYPIISEGLAYPSSFHPLFHPLYPNIINLGYSINDVDKYIERIVDGQGKMVGYALRAGEEIKISGVSGIGAGSSGGHSLEFTFELSSLEVISEFRISITPIVTSNSIPSTIILVSLDPSTQTLHCSLLNPSTQSTLLTESIPYTPSMQTPITLILFLGYSLYSSSLSSTTLHLHRSLSLTTPTASSSDSYHSAYLSSAFLEQITGYTINTAMAGRLTSLNSHKGSIPPQTLYAKVRSTYSFLGSTQLCPMPIPSGDYLIPISTGISPVEVKTKCLRTRTESGYFAEWDGMVSAISGDCEVVGDGGLCHRCVAGMVNEATGVGGALCMLPAQCELSGSTPGTFVRRLYTLNVPGVVGAVDICHQRPTGCESALKPLNCDICEPYKVPSKDKMTCKCALPGCETNSCDNSPCEKCNSLFNTIHIDRSTMLFTCTVDTSCKTKFGTVLSTGLPTSPTTPWCKSCKDPNCNDCSADSENCIKCKDNYFFDSSQTCQQCDANCAQCASQPFNCIACPGTNILIQNATNSAMEYCVPRLFIQSSYFVISKQQLVVKFDRELNQDMRVENLWTNIILSSDDNSNIGTVVAQNPFSSSAQSLGPYQHVSHKITSMRIYMSHIILDLELNTDYFDDATAVISFANSRILNDTSQTHFYPDRQIYLRGVKFFVSRGDNIKYLGLLLGIIIGANGIISLCIPSVKISAISMKIFQLNNYFFLLNVILPYNLFHFLTYFQYGNIMRLALFFNPLGFLTTNECAEFEEKLLRVDKTCQLLANAGPHAFWFVISAVVKGVLEVIQRYRDKKKIPRGRLYSFLRVNLGVRYFIELLNYFHMDLVVYTLLNLMFVKLDGIASFINLVLAVVLMVFFLFLYIKLSVIVANNHKNFLLSNLCDPEGKLGLKRVTASTHEQHELVTKIDPASAPVPSDRKNNSTPGTPEQKGIRKLASPDIRSGTRNLNSVHNARLPPSSSRLDPKQSPLNSPGSPSIRNLEIRARIESGSLNLKLKTLIPPKNSKPLTTPDANAPKSAHKNIIAKIKSFLYLTAKDPREALFSVKTNSYLNKPVVKSMVPVTRDGIKIEAKLPEFDDCNIYRFLFLSCHCMNIYSTYYYVIQLVKEFILGLALVMTWREPIFQTTLFICVFLVILVCNSAFTPLQSSRSNRILQVYTATCLMMAVFFGILAVFAKSLNAKVQFFFIGYGFLACEIIITVCIVILTISVYVEHRNTKRIIKEQQRLGQVNPMASIIGKVDSAVNISQPNQKNKDRDNYSSKADNENENLSPRNIPFRTSKTEIEGPPLSEIHMNESFKKLGLAEGQGDNDTQSIRPVVGSQRDFPRSSSLRPSNSQRKSSCIDTRTSAKNHPPSQNPGSPNQSKIRIKRVDKKDMIKKIQQANVDFPSEEVSIDGLIPNNNN